MLNEGKDRWIGMWTRKGRLKDYKRRNKKKTATKTTYAE